MKKEKDIDLLLEQIEQVCEDELNSILEIGVENYPTDYLKKLYVEWSARTVKIKAFHNHLLKIIIISPLWLILGIIFLLNSYGAWGLIILLFPISVTAAITGTLYMTYKYGTKNEQEEIGQCIENELSRRSEEKRRNWLLGF